MNTQSYEKKGLSPGEIGELAARLENSKIPDYMCGGLLRYIAQGVPPGGFLTSVICNDLKGALSRADGTNKYLINEYVEFLYNYAPMGCWGSEEKFNAWIKLHEAARTEKCLNPSCASVADPVTKFCNPCLETAAKNQAKIEPEDME